MKKIVSKAMLILSVIFFVVSICGVSSVDCLKGFIPMQDAIIDSNNVLYGLQHGNMEVLPYRLISLFYIAIVLILVSGIANFSKSNSIVSNIKYGIITSFAFIMTIFLLITHNYIFFLMLLNLYILLFILFDFDKKDKISICENIIAIIVVTLNFIQLIRHLNLRFNSSNLEYFENKLIELSNTTLKFLLLWIVPYVISLVRDVKNSRNKKCNHIFNHILSLI